MKETKIYIHRNRYGIALCLTSDKDVWKSFVPPIGEYIATSGTRIVKSYKQIVRAAIQSGTSENLFNAAWRISDISSKSGNIDSASIDAEIVESCISSLVNDENSRFYMHG